VVARARHDGFDALPAGPGEDFRAEWGPRFPGWERLVGDDQRRFVCTEIFANLVATTREALDAWVQRLDHLGIPHSPIVPASRGFALGFHDPDGLQVRLYADDPDVAAAAGERTRVAVPADTVRPPGG
jgi:hypothetical protein